ncbi:MAG: hypothetical protein JXB14_04530, partial [Candidatus Altiarchaeota archaeon]|nr:hypothetical protein [Candidatus Altiarchaeota archaeon]
MPGRKSRGTIRLMPARKKPGSDALRAQARKQRLSPQEITQKRMRENAEHSVRLTSTYKILSRGLAVSVRKGEITPGMSASVRQAF